MLPPLSVLIVDDEPLARLRLRSMVEACTEPRAIVVGEASHPSEALRQLLSTPCDVVLLDIVMPGGSGLKLADEIRRLPTGLNGPRVVFVTAHAAHALRAFELDAADYLTKPVKRDRLQAALLRVAQRLAQELPAAPIGAVLVVSDRGRVLRVPAAEVLYLKAEQKYVTLCSHRGTWLLDDALADLEQRLGTGFLRVHRNAVVAVSAVRALKRRHSEPSEIGEGAEEAGWQLQVSNGDWLAVSRRQLAAVSAVLREVVR